MTDTSNITTARDIVIDAIDESGALGVGQSPLPEDTNKIFVPPAEYNYRFTSHNLDRVTVFKSIFLK